jgi:hypothetical protein
MIQDSNLIQQTFSAEKRPTLWRALPAIEELQTAWEAKHDDPKYVAYRTAINDGLTKLNKYYSRFDEKPAYILALSMFYFQMRNCSDVDILVLHPYFKLAYIKMAWGGEKEQKEERRKGNKEAKNWQDEAQQILENTVCPALPGLCL